MDIYIIGAGMAGLLAARMLKARGHHPVVLEAQSSLPNNHHAVLRFRSNVVSEVTGIPFTKVNMIKCTVPYRNPVAEALAYSYKATGTYSTDRSISSGTTMAERWIAPNNFIAQMAEGLDIKYSQFLKFDGLYGFDLYGFGEDGHPIISTIPMPKLVPLLNYKHLGGNDFHYHEGMVAKAYIKDCYAFASLYVPDPEYPAITRISITGDELTVELKKYHTIDEATGCIADALNLFGIEGGPQACYEAHLGQGKVQVYHQHYSKIEPIDDDQRKRFISWATDQRNIYALGRFATWRPGLLLDDLVNDIKRIEQWIVKNNNYDRRK